MTFFLQKKQNLEKSNFWGLGGGWGWGIGGGGGAGCGRKGG